MLFYTEEIFHYQLSLYIHIYAYIYLSREATQVVSRMGPCPYQKSTGQYVCHRSIESHVCLPSVAGSSEFPCYSDVIHVQ